MSPSKVLPLLLLLSLFLASICTSEAHRGIGRRKTLDFAGEGDDGPEPVVIKKKTTTTSLLSKPKNQTKLATIATSSKNQTKLIKASITTSSKNQTKLIKASMGISSKNQTNNSLGISNNKNQTKTPSQPPKKKTTKEDEPMVKFKTKLNSTDPTKKNKSTDPTDKKPKRSWPSWVDQEDDADNDDLVSEFRTLPSKFQEQLLPDLERISKTSKVYLNRANKEMTKGFKPYVGNKYAATIASSVSFASIIIPLILVSLIFNKIKAYFSLQKIIIFIQIYLSIYFSILCISSLFTGLEPLKFLYATSHSTYVCLQLLQTLAYVLYLLLLLMYLVLVFSTDTALPAKLLGLAQTLVGYAVGLHYYVTVFHRTVLHQPPRTSWKIHAIYAASFLLICVFTRADRTKKLYLTKSS